MKIPLNLHFKHWNTLPGLLTNDDIGQETVPNPLTGNGLFRASQEVWATSAFYIRATN